mgnify:CR=1 FL=1
MATTIKVEPQVIQSGFNEVITVLDSTEKSEPKFNWIVKLYIAGAYSSKLKVSPNPDGFGVVNLSKHIESYLSSNLLLSDLNAFKKIVDSYARYNITIEQEYVKTTGFTTVTDNGGFCQYNFSDNHYFNLEDFVTVSSSTVPAYDGEQEVTNVVSTTAVVTTKVFTLTATGDAVLTSGATSTIPDAAVFSSDRFATNNVLDWIDYNDFDYDDYDMDSANLGLFFTNLENYQTVLIDDHINLNFYNANSDAFALEVSSSLGVTRIENIYDFTSNTTKMLSVGVAPADINNHSGSAVVVVSGSGTNVTTAIDSYSVKLVDNVGTPVSETKYFNMKSECSMFNNYKLMYLNRGGSFSTFNFELGSRKKFKVNRKNYRKNYGVYTDASTSFGWNSFDRGLKSLSTSEIETYTITSDYITEVEGNKIIDLIRSPEVYQLDNNGILRAIDIQTKSVQLKTRVQDNLINYSIDFNYSTQNTTQR